MYKKYNGPRSRNFNYEIKNFLSDLNLSQIILHHIAEHAENPEQFEKTVIGEDWVVSLNVIGRAEVPTCLIHFAFQPVLLSNW